jgi:hypothetical protein
MQGSGWGVLFVALMASPSLLAPQCWHKEHRIYDRLAKAPSFNLPTSFQDVKTPFSHCSALAYPPHFKLGHLNSSIGCESLHAPEIHTSQCRSFCSDRALSQFCASCHGARFEWHPGTDIAHGGVVFIYTSPNLGECISLVCSLPLDVARLFPSVQLASIAPRSPLL